VRRLTRISNADDGDRVTARPLGSKTVASESAGESGSLNTSTTAEGASPSRSPPRGWELRSSACAAARRGVLISRATAMRAMAPPLPTMSVRGVGQPARRLVCRRTKYQAPAPTASRIATATAMGTAGGAPPVTTVPMCAPVPGVDGAIPIDGDVAGGVELAWGTAPCVTGGGDTAATLGMGAAVAGF
jgi:hypothetical protein